MLAAALEAEVDALRRRRSPASVDERGRRLVVRNGHAEPRDDHDRRRARSRSSAPRVNDRRVDDDDGERCGSAARSCRRGARKSPKVTEVLPLMYLHGMSHGRLRAGAGRVLRVGGGAVGVGDHPADHASGRPSSGPSPHRDLSDRDYVYVWVDGVHFNVRLDEDRLCCLVIVGVRARRHQGAGRHRRRLPGVDRVWADLLRDLRRRGMRAPVRRRRRRRARVLGGAARRVARDPRRSAAGCTRSPTSSTRCRSRVQPTARRMLAEIRDAEDRAHAVTRHRRVRSRVRRQVAQGGRQDRRRRSSRCSPSTTSPPSTGST